MNVGAHTNEVDKTLPLVERAAAFVEAVLSVVGPKSVAESEDGVGRSALPVVDFVRPGVRTPATGIHAKTACRSSTTSAVVPTADAVGLLVDGAEIRVRPRARVNLRRVSADRLPAGVVDGVSERRAQRRSVDILRALQIDAAAEDSGYGEHHVLGELPLHGDRGLFGIRRLQVRRTARPAWKRPA